MNREELKSEVATNLANCIENRAKAMHAELIAELDKAREKTRRWTNEANAARSEVDRLKRELAELQAKTVTPNSALPPLRVAVGRDSQPSFLVASAEGTAGVPPVLPDNDSAKGDPQTEGVRMWQSTYLRAWDGRTMWILFDEGWGEDCKSNTVEAISSDPSCKPLSPAEVAAVIAKRPLPTPIPSQPAPAPAQAEATMEEAVKAWEKAVYAHYDMLNEDPGMIRTDAASALTFNAKVEAARRVAELAKAEATMNEAVDVVGDAAEKREAWGRSVRGSREEMVAFTEFVEAARRVAEAQAKEERK